jgi:AhpD family alkylhydroperoxidase
MNESILQYEEKMWELFNLTKEQNPDLFETYYGPVKKAVYSEGALGSKTKRLMSLAIAIQAGCKDCMISQTSKALDLGATPAEIFEVCSVAISMGGTLAASKVLVVANYLEARGLLKTNTL